MGIGGQPVWVTDTMLWNLNDVIIGMDNFWYIFGAYTKGLWLVNSFISLTFSGITNIFDFRDIVPKTFNLYVITGLLLT